VETSTRPIIIQPAVGVTDAERRAVAAAVQHTANVLIERLMAEREQGTPTAAPKREQANA
jgi:hypothetical protein